MLVTVHTPDGDHLVAARAVHGVPAAVRRVEALAVAGVEFDAYRCGLMDHLEVLGDRLAVLQEAVLAGLGVRAAVRREVALADMLVHFVDWR